MKKKLIGGGNYSDTGTYTQNFFNQSESDYSYKMISVYGELQQSYFIQASIEMGDEWIRNPARLNFQPNPQGYSKAGQLHSRWLSFLKKGDHRLLSKCLLKNAFDIEILQERKTILGLEFDIIMKGIDKVEHDFLPKIQNSTESKETYDRLKLWEIFELQRSKNLVNDDQSDPDMSWLPGKTFEEKFDYFVQRKKEENFLELLNKVPTGRYCMIIHNFIGWPNTLGFIVDDLSADIKMAFRKAWQKMKRTLSLQTRQSLVTSELWEIFLAKDQMASGAEDSAQREADIEKLRLMRKKRLEKTMASNRNDFSSQIEPIEKGNLQLLMNELLPC